jgi:hypothetical protein
VVLKELPGTGQHQVTSEDRLSRADAPPDDRHPPGVAVEVGVRREEAGAGRMTVAEKCVGTSPHSLRGAAERPPLTLVMVIEQPDHRSLM